MCPVGLFFFAQPLNFVLFEQVLQDQLSPRDSRGRNAEDTLNPRSEGTLTVILEKARHKPAARDAIQIVEVGPWNLALPYFVPRRE
jgi:hypothetical protein